jgi:streptogramin lyase
MRKIIQNLRVVYSGGARYILLAIIMVVSPFVTLAEPASAEPVINEFQTPASDSSYPFDLAKGSDGATWYTDLGSQKIGRITTSGAITEYTNNSPDFFPQYITSGPDGALWFTDAGTGKIGRITTSGDITEFSVPDPNSSPGAITAGSDGALWFTEQNANRIGRITTAGAVTEYEIPPPPLRQGQGGNTGGGQNGQLPSAYPLDITVGSDGTLWFTTTGRGGAQDEIYRISTTGVIDLVLPTPNPIPPGPGQPPLPDCIPPTDSNPVTCPLRSNLHSLPINIITGPDNAVWFMDNGGNIGRIGADNFVLYHVYDTDSRVVDTPMVYGGVDLVAGPDGAVWFTANQGDGVGGLVGRITTSGVVTKYPTSDFVQNIAVGSDGALWFGMSDGNQVGKIGQLIPEPVLNNPAITSDNSVTATYGVAMTPFTVTAIGDKTPTLSKTGALPSGVTFHNNHDGTATISGTPTGNASGVYTITIKAKNSSGSVTQTFTMTVNRAPAFKSIPSSQLKAVVGSAYSLSIITTGYPAPAITENGDLPSGLSFNDNGDGTATISGTPTDGTGDVYPITLTATNDYGSIDYSATLTVNQAPAITSADSVTASYGTAMVPFTVTTAGFPVASLSKTSPLPTGLTFHNNSDGTATISGTPHGNANGAYVITIKASNSSGSVIQTFTVIVS